MTLLKTALLLCAEAGGWDIKVVGENAEESPYVAMTSELIKVFPKRGGTFPIEPDASSGSYFWALDWLLWVRGPNKNMEQIVVNRWPCTRWQIDSDYPKYRNLIELPAFLSRKVHLGDSIMAAIVKAPLNRPPAATFIHPDSPSIQSFAAPIEFRDLGRLRLQECERVYALKTELTKCNAHVEEFGDTLRVYSDRLLSGPVDGIETYHDHRMAMCFAVLGLKVPGIKIKNPACVKKTFPNFFQKLAAAPPHGLGATILDANTGQTLSHEELFAH